MFIVFGPSIQKPFPNPKVLESQTFCKLEWNSIISLQVLVWWWPTFFPVTAHLLVDRWPSTRESCFTACHSHFFATQQGQCAGDGSDQLVMPFLPGLGILCCVPIREWSLHIMSYSTEKHQILGGSTAPMQTQNIWRLKFWVLWVSNV